MLYRVQLNLRNASLHDGQIIPPEVLLAGYRAGIFPMATSKTGIIDWFTSDPRGIIELNKFRVPTSLNHTLRTEKFDLTVNADFEAVIRGCGERKDSWISETIVQSYLNLHKLGFAHSVETWMDGRHAGGIYGVAIGGAFFGESMFYRVSDASKVALVHLVKRLTICGFRLFDIQMVTPLTERFGGKLIALEDYMVRLKRALKEKCRFS